MKKTLQQSGEAAPGQQSADYMVGQVSGSLFQKKSAASGSLTALFSTAAPAGPLLFQPAPKPVQKSTEAKEQQKEAPEVKGQLGQKKKKKMMLKNKSEADQKLENRESSLQNADEDEQGQETPVKKKRKKKATEPGTENDVEQWVMKRQKLRDRKQEDMMKRKRTVFVGNLPVGCTKKTLQSLFRDKGAIESVRFRSVVREDPAMSRKVAVIQRKAHPKRQSLNAYVVFRDEGGVVAALERNGMEIEKDFHIRVDRVTDGSSHDHKRSVFVGNLSFEINDLAFRRHFEECGAVEAVRLVRDQSSGLGKGFGYVLFESADSVQLALELDGTKLEGRSIRVKRSVKKEKVKKTDGKGTTGRTGRGPGRGPTRGSTRGLTGGSTRGPTGGSTRGPTGGSTRGPTGGSTRGPTGGPTRGSTRGPTRGSTRGLTGGSTRGSTRGPTRGSGRERGGFKSHKQLSGNQQRPTVSSSSFKGEMVDPNRKAKKKGLKKKLKPNKSVHI